MEKVEKELYSFDIKVEKETEVETIRKDGETEVKEIKKVKKKVPVTVTILKPTRRQIEQAQIEYAKKLSSLIKEGVLTKNMIAKKYSDTGGYLTEEEGKELLKSYTELNNLKQEYAEKTIRLGNKDDLTKEEKESLISILDKIDSISRFIGEVESQYSSLFDYTADSLAANHVILWYALNLVYLKNSEEKYEPYFKGNTFDEKLNDYYQKEEEKFDDNFYIELRKRVNMYIVLWYSNLAKDKKDFERIDREGF